MPKNSGFDFGKALGGCNVPSQTGKEAASSSSQNIQKKPSLPFNPAEMQKAMQQMTQLFNPEEMKKAQEIGARMAQQLFGQRATGNQPNQLALPSFTAAELVKKALEMQGLSGPVVDALVAGMDALEKKNNLAEAAKTSAAIALNDPQVRDNAAKQLKEVAKNLGLPDEIVNQAIEAGMKVYDSKEEMEKEVRLQKAQEAMLKSAVSGSICFGLKALGVPKSIVTAAVNAGEAAYEESRNFEQAKQAALKAAGFEAAKEAGWWCLGLPGRILKNTKVTLAITAYCAYQLMPLIWVAVAASQSSDLEESTCPAPSGYFGLW